MSDVKAVHPWNTNADLVVSLRTLGYLHDSMAILDPTWGRGTFWKVWTPPNLTRHDLALDGVSFTALPHDDATFDAVTYDPPYKLNGTATPDVDGRYGVESYASADDRHALMAAGLAECARVLRPGGYLLMKCQDQVNAGRVRWQTVAFAAQGHALGLELVDMLHMVGGRPQPAGRRQVHARRNASTMLVFQRPASGRAPRGWL